MFTYVYHAAHNGQSFQVPFSGHDDICRLVGNTPDHLDRISSGDDKLVYWWCPRGQTRPVNRTATAFLLATTILTARSVPLLRGDVVIASHHNGQLDGLSAEQFQQLTGVRLSGRDERILDRRYTRDRRQLIRAAKAHNAATRRSPLTQHSW